MRIDGRIEVLNDSGTRCTSACIESLEAGARNIMCTRVRLRALYVDVVTDHRTQQAARSRADQSALEAVPARRSPDDGSRARADCSVTAGVLDHLPLRCRSRIVRAR